MYEITGLSAPFGLFGLSVLYQLLTSNSKTMEILNKKVIIRADRAGVFFGTLVAKRETPAGVEVELHNSRRIWRWRGAASLSQLATEGIKNPDGCMFTVTVPQHMVMQVIEIIPCTEQAVQSIEGVRVWRND